MPNYEFICKDCKEITEVKASLAEKEKGIEQQCPACGSKNMVQYYGNMIVIPTTHLH